MTIYSNHPTSSTTGYENDFACHFLGASAREARRWAHRMVRPGSIDDSTGRPGCAGLSGKIGYQLHSTCSPGSARDSTARPGNRRYAISTIILGRAHNQSHSTNSPPSRRQRSTSGGKWSQTHQIPESESGDCSIRKPASKEMISHPVELCETAVCFLHIHLIGTNV